MHNYSLPAGVSGAAKPVVEGNPSVGREAASERSHHQNAGVGGIDQIKSYPVIAGQFFVKPLRNVLHERFRIGGSLAENLKLFEQFFVRRHLLLPSWV